MFVLRVTSGPKVVGLKSDDGFLMGQFSSSTGFLVMFCAALGAMGGVYYVAIRGFLPEGRRAVLTGLLAALIIGSVVIHPEGVDFTAISPRWLALALFLVLPALYGAATSGLVENLARRTSNRVIPWLAVLGLLAGPPVLGFSGSFLLPLLLVVGIALLILATRVDAISRFCSSMPVTWIGRLALTIGGAFAGVLIVKDGLAIL